MPGVGWMRLVAELSAEYSLDMLTITPLRVLLDVHGN